MSIIKALQKSMRGAASAVIPIAIFVLILGFTIVPKPVDVALLFIVGAGFIIVGLAVFTLGADLAMTPMGDALGTLATKKRNLVLLVFLGLISGFIITIAEPGPIVLAEQTPNIPALILIIAVAIGVGIFLAIGLVRTALNLHSRPILLVSYGVLFALACFASGDFLPLAFDAGGATTGAMTVPFILALGVAVARSSGGGRSNSFGLIAICSIGPIIAVLILSLIYSPEGTSVLPAMHVPSYGYTNMLLAEFFAMISTYIWEVSLSLIPIVLLFAVAKILAVKLKVFAIQSWQVEARQIAKIIIGALFTFGGLVLFLTGANVGFLLAGNLLGESLASLSHRWLLVPIGTVLGFLVITAEPAVRVLNKQVTEITSGAISQKAMRWSLAIGVATAVGLSMMRVLTHLPIMWILVPGYALALGLSFFVPKKFTSIAFDAGGVASGPLTSAFLLPFAIGASIALEGNVAADAFGLIAMVALTPLITIQMLGLIHIHKTRRSKS
ncbi:MAG: DUF1538 domain-containing protein [Coriobacteriia bacterium]|nr:DUF1538 domain-containing protein [Coriobacteriia bacterium]